MSIRTGPEMCDYCGFDDAVCHLDCKTREYAVYCRRCGYTYKKCLVRDQYTVVKKTPIAAYKVKKIVNRYSSSGCFEKISELFQFIENATVYKNTYEIAELSYKRYGRWFVLNLIEGTAVPFEFSKIAKTPF